MHAHAQLLAAAPPLAHTSGCRRYSRYRLLAPFEGGFAHVALQALGWTLYAAALTACLALLRAAGKVDDGSSGGPGERASSPFGGLFLAVGLAGFAAHGLIDASVVMYSYEGLDEGADGECDAIRRHARARLLDACGWFLRTRWGRLGAMLQAMSALLLVAADGAVGAVPDAFVRSVVGVSVMGTTLAASVAHGVLGCWARGAPLWAPFEGGERYVPLQALGWLLLAAYLNTIMCLLPLDLSGHAADGTLLATALIGCAAVLCLMASVGNWDPEAAAPLRAPHRARLSGRLPLGGEAAVAACLMFAASIIAASCRRTSDGRAALCGLPASVAGRAALPVSYGIAIRIAILGMHLAAPIAHAGGMRLHGSPYSLYQPFSGGPAFIFAQMLGWTLYGASALASLVVLSNADSGNVTLGDGVVRALFPLAFFAQAVVLASVRYFDAGEGANTERDEDGADAVLGGSTDIAHNAVPSEGAQVPLQRGAAAGKLLPAPLLPAPPEPATLPWTADTAFALFLSAMAASTVAAADLWGAVPADARRPLTAAGMVAFVIALCVGALAGNGRAFVHDAAVQNCRLLLQGLGYSLAALAMVAQLTMLQNALQDVPRGAAALSGALQLAANTLVTCASVYGGDGVGGTAGRRREAAAAARREKVAQLALAAVDESLRVARDGATAAGGGGGGAATALREASTTVALRAHPGVVALLEALALELSGEAEAAHAVDDAAWRLQDRRVTRLQSARLWRGGSLAAAAGALLLALFADGALLLAEVGTPHLRPAAPVLLAASTVAGVAAALGVHCGAGPAQHGGSWRLVGPFIGGRAFVLRSAVGWSLCSSALVLAVTALYVAALSGGRSHARAHGVATCVGFMMVAGHRALTEALDRYVPALAAEATDHMSGGTCECGTVTARARDAMVLGLRRAPMGAVVAAASTALFALSDSVLAATATRPSPYLRPALACAAAAMLGSGPLALGASLGSTGDRVPRRLCEGAPAIQVRCQAPKSGLIGAYTRCV